jgi:GntR family transcriptional regulator, arabinose operon transcriptional repressor
VALVPKYQQVKMAIEQQLEENILQAGDQLESEELLARRYHVSRITIKRALNDLVLEGRVKRIKGKGSFIREDAVPSRERIVELVYQGYDLLNQKLGNTIVFNMLKGAQSVLEKHDYALVLKDAENDVGNEQTIIDQAIRNNAAGMLIDSTDPYKLADFYRRLSDHQVPFVLLDRYVPWVDTNVVASNNVLGAMKVVEYLAGLNHSRIGFASYLSLEITSIAERYSGFRNACKKYGLEGSPECVWITQDLDKIVRSLHDAVMTKKITAVFCANDSFAVYLLRELMKHGVSVPRDLSVVGFDDVLDLSLHPVPLTTVHQASFMIGQEAAKLLLGALKGEHQNRHILLSPTLIVRASCAPNGPIPSAE